MGPWGWWGHEGGHYREGALQGKAGCGESGGEAGKTAENRRKTAKSGDDIGQYLVLNLDNLILQRQLAFFQPLDL